MTHGGRFGKRMKAPSYRLTASTGIHKGDRDYQQDQVLLLSHARAKGCMLAVLADGMGGRSGGRKASDQVMMTARQLFERYDPTTDDPQETLKQLLSEAHTVIKLIAISAEEEPHSTVAAFLLNPQGDCHWIHSGDSRIYHFRDNKLIKRTLDHSYVQMLVDYGEITEEQARTHPKSNVLMGCLGSATSLTSTIHHIEQMCAGDTLMACSDGLWHYFTDEELGNVMAALKPREATEFLIEKARTRAHGGGDNLSLVIVKFEALET
jgi:serine/threonine protein phosphatase PrpC